MVIACSKNTCVANVWQMCGKCVANVWQMCGKMCGKMAAEKA